MVQGRGSGTQRREARFRATEAGDNRVHLRPLVLSQSTFGREEASNQISRRLLDLCILSVEYGSAFCKLVRTCPLHSVSWTSVAWYAPGSAGSL